MKKKNLIKKSIATLLLSAFLILSSFAEMPQKVFAGSTVTDISAGLEHALVVKSDGTLWGAGKDDRGQLGIGLEASETSKGNIRVWKQVFTNVSKAIGGYGYSFAIKTDGSLWATGINSGQLGFGNSYQVNTWTQVPGVYNVKDIAVCDGYDGSSVSYLLKNDGTLWYAGYSNPFSDSGSPDRSYWTFQQIMTNVKQVSTAGWSTLIVKNDGTLWAKGNNEQGQLGNGTTTNITSSFKQVLTGVQQAEVESSYSWALKTDGTVWGAGSAGHSTLPGNPGTNTTWKSLSVSNVKQISANGTCGFALKNDGTLWGIGQNSNSQLGEGPLDAGGTKMGGLFVTPWKQVLPGQYAPTATNVRYVSKVVTNNNYSMAIGDGNLYMAGTAREDEFGDDYGNYPLKSRNWWELGNVQARDTTPPNISVSQNPTAYTKGSVTLTATASDDVSLTGIQTPDGNWVSASTVNYTVNSNGGYYFVAKDSSGNTRSANIYVSNIDTIVPTISLTSSVFGGIVTISATASDVGSGLKSITLPNGQITNGSTATYPVTSNGTYTFYATDNVGNVGSQSISITNADSTPPSIILTPSTTAWTRGSVTITERATDTGSGVSQVQSPNGTWVNGSSTSYTAYSNGTYTFRAKDNAGNIGTQNITISNIDTYTPSLSLSASTTSWTKGSVTITAVGSDTGGSGINRITLPNGSSVSGSVGYYNVSANGTYSFTVYDNAGNSYTNSIYVSNIDTISPTLNISQNSTTWVKGSVNITFNATDSESGIATIKLPDNSFTNTINGTFVASSNGTYTFVATDKAGNQTTKSVNITNVDSTSPTLSLTPNSTNWINGDVVITATGKDNESGVKSITLPDGSVVNKDTATFTVSNNGTYTFTVTDNVGNTTTNYVTISNIDKVAPTLKLTQDPTSPTNGNVVITVTASDIGSGVKSITLPDGSVINGDKTTYVVSSNGKYDFSVVDNLGNVTNQSITISNIDNTAPNLDLTPSTNQWTNKNIVITAMGSDSESGVKSITLPDGTVVNSSTATYTVTSNGTYKFIITDKAGNKTIKNIAVPNIDIVNPTLSLKQDSTLLTNIAKVNIVGVDDLSGIDKIILPDGTVINGSTTTYNVKSNGTYTFTVFDKAGNKVTASITVNNIIEVNTISGIDHFEYKLDGATIQDWTTYNGSLNITNEGITTISARAIDKSGNISNIATSLVKIDRSKPINGNVQIIVK